jgi:hypothetical protein
MPSGITAPIAEGKDITAAEFLIRCAKQFGGLMHMQDEPLSAPIVPREANLDHYDKSIARLEKDLAKYQAMSLEEAEAAVEEDYQEDLARHNQITADKNATRARYEAVLAKVRTWVPPTPEHDNLKEFAVKQLVESIDWDCKVYEGPTKLSAQEYLTGRIEGLQGSLNFYKKQRADEIKRVEEANKWVTTLVESVMDFHNKSLEGPAE